MEEEKINEVKWLCLQTATSSVAFLERKFPCQVPAGDTVQSSNDHKYWNTTVVSWDLKTIRETIWKEK